MGQIFISQSNTSLIPLGAGQEFVGEAEDLAGWQEGDICLAYEPPGASGILTFEYSIDQVHWDISEPRTITTNRNIPIPLRTVMPFFRLRYLNGGVPQTELRLALILHKESGMRITRFADQVPSLNEPLEFVRVIRSSLPDGGSTSSAQAAILAELVQKTEPSDQQHVLVDNLPGTQPVSGTLDVTDRSARLLGHTVVDSGAVTANIGTTNGLALDATLTGGTSRAIARGAAKGGTPAADATATSIDVDHTGLDVVVKSSALPAGAATEVTVSKRFSGGKVTSATIMSSNGDNVVYTPAAGKILTLYWIFLSSSSVNTFEVLATVKLGSKVVYECFLGAPGAFAHWEPVVADSVNDPLIVNLTLGSQQVAVSYTVTEA